MYKEKQKEEELKLKTINYLIPTDLWSAVKHKAIDQGISLKDAVVDALSDYAQKVKK